MVETTPARIPMVKARAGWYMIPAFAPIATPPASVALSTSFIVRYFPRKALIMKVDMQLPVREKMVLTTIWFCW